MKIFYGEVPEAIGECGMSYAENNAYRDGWNNGQQSILAQCKEVDVDRELQKLRYHNDLIQQKNAYLYDNGRGKEAKPFVSFSQWLQEGK